MSLVEKAVADERASQEGGGLPKERRRYVAPRLIHLGSVRELTLGGTAGIAEGGGTFVKAM